MKNLSLLFGIVVVLWCGPLRAATYYIDPSCGSSGDGTTTNCSDTAHGPFKDWASVTWASGNTYSQNGGTTYQGTITVGTSNVILNTYGTGYATIDGGVAIAPNSWSGPDANGVYSQPKFNSPVLEDGIYLHNSLVTAPTNPPSGQYSEYWGNATEYYHPSSGTPANHTVEKVANAGIELGLNSNVTIQGFSFTKVLYGIHSIPATNGAISNINIRNNMFSNIEFGIWLAHKNADMSNITIENNSFDLCFDGVEIYDAPGSTSGNNLNIRIDNNTFTHSSTVNSPGNAYDWDYVDMNGWDKEAIGIQDMSNSNIYKNRIWGHARGIEVYVAPGQVNNNNNYYQNYIVTSRAPICFQPNSAASSFGANHIYYNILIQVKGDTLGGMDDLNSPGSGSDADEGYGVSVGNVASPTTIYNTIYNNVIYGTLAECLSVVGQYYDVENNIMFAAPNAYAMAPSTNIKFDYNLYYGAQWGDSFFLNGSEIGKPAWQAAGYDVHGIFDTDPKFSNGSNNIPATSPWVLVYPSPLNMLPTDFTVLPGSPATGKGVDVGLTNDFVGNVVKNPPSIGAYEIGLAPVTGVKLMN